MTQELDPDVSVSGGCVFCGKYKLRMYHLPDSQSRHVFCDGCGAAGPWGETAKEALTLYRAPATSDTAYPSCKWTWNNDGDHAGFWEVQCKADEDWPVQLLHDGARFCTFCGGNLIVKAS